MPEQEGEEQQEKQWAPRCHWCGKNGVMPTNDLKVRILIPGVGAELCGALHLERLETDEHAALKHAARSYDEIHVAVCPACWKQFLVDTLGDKAELFINPESGHRLEID